MENANKILSQTSVVWRYLYIYIYENTYGLEFITIFFPKI